MWLLQPIGVLNHLRRLFRYVAPSGELRPPRGGFPSKSPVWTRSGEH